MERFIAWAQTLDTWVSRSPFVNHWIVHPLGYLLLGPVPFGLVGGLLLGFGFGAAVVAGAWFSMGFYLYREFEDYLFRIIHLDQSPRVVLWLEDRVLDVVGPAVVHVALLSLRAFGVL